MAGLKDTPVGVIAGLAQAGVGALQAGISAFGMAKAKRQAFQAFDKQSTYKADPEVQRMLEMRRGRLGMGLTSSARQIAQQGIGTSAAQATSAAQQMGGGRGLGMIGAIQKQSQRGTTQLAGMEEQAKEQNLAGFERAVGAASSERARQFASESEKEQARTAIKMQQLAAKKAAVSQGVSQIGAGLANAAGAGMFEGGGSGKKKSGSGVAGSPY